MVREEVKRGGHEGEERRGGDGNLHQKSSGFWNSGKKDNMKYQITASKIMFKKGFLQK